MNNKKNRFDVNVDPFERHQTTILWPWEKLDDDETAKQCIQMQHTCETANICRYIFGKDKETLCEDITSLILSYWILPELTGYLDRWAVKAQFDTKWEVPYLEDERARIPITFNGAYGGYQLTRRMMEYLIVCGFGVHSICGRRTRHDFLVWSVWDIYNKRVMASEEERWELLGAMKVAWIPSICLPIYTVCEYDGKEKIDLNTEQLLVKVCNDELPSVDRSDHVSCRNFLDKLSSVIHITRDKAFRVRVESQTPCHI